jgi:hypothetical protein
MMLFEDGTLLLVRRGHIRAEYKVDEKTEISQVAKNSHRFTIKFHNRGSEVIECPDAETWASILHSMKRLHIANTKF